MGRLADSGDDGVLGLDVIISEQELLSKNRRSVAAIYCIKNRANGKVYIGSTTCYVDRRACHFSELRLGRHHNPHLQNAFNKYGSTQFEIFILTPCCVDELLSMEQMFIDLYRASDRRFGYNVRSHVERKPLNPKPLVKPPRPKFRHTEETKQKMRERRASKETRLKISQARLGRPTSIATRNKLRAINLGKEIPALFKPVVQLTISGQYLARYPSAKEASLTTGVNRGCISMCCRAVHKTGGGFVWKFESDYSALRSEVAERKS